MPSFFITTAIDYVNGFPHIGHAYEKVLTDVMARYRRQQGESVFFLTGVDEHGQKVQQSAEKQGRSPQEFCDEMAAHYEKLYRRLNVSFDDFVRTTQARHQEVVQAILQKLYDAGEIYLAEYEGYYSARVEQFLTEKEMVDGIFPSDYGEVIRLKESNYFFRLAKHQDWLRDFLTQNPEWIFPAFRMKEVLGALEKPITDLCISRPKSRLSWGIPLPFDDSQVTYVWFDALINYISVVGYGKQGFGNFWPGHHVIGKDIMVPAHAVYWPIMLKALDLPQPKQLIVHGWWTQNKEKMSKSVGNVVDPLTLIETYGVDAFRYFVMREMAIGYDADFSAEQFHLRYESELGGNLGNLLNRTVSMITRYCEGVIPARLESARTELDGDLESKVLLAVATFRENMDKLQAHIALTELWRGLQRANQFVEENAPWKLAKDPTHKDRLNYVMAQLAAANWVVIRELAPILPETVAKAMIQLGSPASATLFSDLSWPRHLAGKTVGSPTPLFPRLEQKN